MWVGVCRYMLGWEGKMTRSMGTETQAEESRERRQLKHEAGIEKTCLDNFLQRGSRLWSVISQKYFQLTGFLWAKGGKEATFL